MAWNWQQDNWPKFTWDNTLIEPLEAKFLHEAGVLIGASKHIDKDEKQQLTIEIMTSEAIKTSEIEGEYLDRDSVQSSLRRQFGLQTDHRRVQPAETGIAQMMVQLYQEFASPLTHDTLFSWHKMLMNGRTDVAEVGKYRSIDDPMQVVSGRLDKPTIHFEAPPSVEMEIQMDEFVEWFNRSAPEGEGPLPALTRAAISHLYFVSIHPFEDGNGRIARAISEKALSQSFKQPTLIALSQTIQQERKDYYSALEVNNKQLEVTDWVSYFTNTILDAQIYSQTLVDFLISKAKIFERLGSQMNKRQTKVITRLFNAGPGGFDGGLSAENYISISNTSRATATRDLQALVDLGILYRTGELKGTRYHLAP